MADSQIQNILKARQNDFIKTFSQGPVKYIVYNRPHLSNAFTLDMYIKAAQAIKAAVKEASIKFIVVYGEGKNFCSGNDLSNFSDPDFANFTALQMATHMAKIILQDYIQAIISSPKPIFAIAQGFSVGVGFTQLALYDRVYIVEGAKFRAPFVKLAQGPEMCSSYTFPKLFGVALAVEIIVEGKEVGAEELLERKFGTLVKSFEEGMTKCSQYLKMLDKLDYSSLRQTRSLMRQFQRSRLLQINQMECRNLVERWLNPNLMETLINHLEAQREKRKARL